LAKLHRFARGIAGREMHLASRTVSNRHACGVGATGARRGSYLTKENNMNLTVVSIGPVVALIAGILILIMPRLLNYIVAIYLIVIGVLGLAAHF
jgi:hypothetical protein